MTIREQPFAMILLGNKLDVSKVMRSAAAPGSVDRLQTSLAVQTQLPRQGSHRWMDSSRPAKPAAALCRQCLVCYAAGAAASRGSGACVAYRTLA
eukprot:2401023-Pleurochrysis_carterae.AAC.5